MKLTALLLLIFIFTQNKSFSQVAEPNESDKSAISKSVQNWADSTFFKYDEPRFENFIANYTDEYMMATLRTGSFEKSIKRLKASKAKGTFNGTEKDYEEAINDLTKRKEDAEAVLINFTPKVTHYSVIFWANIKLDSGIYNYVKHEVQLNEKFKVIKSEVVGNIGDNSKGNIIYK